MAHILKIEMPSNGQLKNRVIDESLAGGPDAIAFEQGIKESEADSSGIITKLSYEKVGDTWYFDSAGFKGRTVGLPTEDK